MRWRRPFVVRWIQATAAGPRSPAQSCFLTLEWRISPLAPQPAVDVSIRAMCALSGERPANRLSHTDTVAPPPPLPSLHSASCSDSTVALPQALEKVSQMCHKAKLTARLTARTPRSTLPSQKVHGASLFQHSTLAAARCKLLQRGTIVTQHNLLHLLNTRRLLCGYKGCFGSGGMEPFRRVYRSLTLAAGNSVVDCWTPYPRRSWVRHPRALGAGLR